MRTAIFLLVLVAMPTYTMGQLRERSPQETKFLKVLPRATQANQSSRQRSDRQTSQQRRDDGRRNDGRRNDGRRYDSSRNYSHGHGHYGRGNRGLPYGYPYSGYGYSPFVTPPVYSNPYGGIGYGGFGYGANGYGGIGVPSPYGYGTSFSYGAPGFGTAGFNAPLDYGVGRPNYGYGPSPGLAPAPTIGPTILAPPPIQSRVISSRFVPNSSLSSVPINFFNDGVREIQVSIYDLKTERPPKTFRLAPGQKQGFQMNRDNGGTVVEEVETVDDFGNPRTKTVRRPRPPRTLYGIVVHEIDIQSVAIDRTPGANNKIEDIRFRGKPLGQFELPAGQDLQPGTLEVVSIARSQGNQNAIDPILAEEDRGDGLSPTERAIIDAQRSAVGN